MIPNELITCNAGASRVGIHHIGFALCVCSWCTGKQLQGSAAERARAILDVAGSQLAVVLPQVQWDFKYAPDFALPGRQNYTHIFTHQILW